MKSRIRFYKWVCGIVICMFTAGLNGCNGGAGAKETGSSEDRYAGTQGMEQKDEIPGIITEEEELSSERTEPEGTSGDSAAEGTSTEMTAAGDSGAEGTKTEAAARGRAAENTTEDAAAEPVIREADWSEYFDGLNGAAVVYDASENEYTVFNRDLAMTRRPPCSTFKIVSSLIGLEHGVIKPEDSVRTWSKVAYWNEEWNRDIDFQDAFRASCVWYFREVIDEIGRERMQRELDRLSYGNCDISQWEGRLSTNIYNRPLTGFWIESSLTISPWEQAEVMERIFGEDSVYSKQSRDILKQVMLVEEENRTGPLVYGKTGMGKIDGAVADAWFAGFAEKDGKRLYYCVYLGRTDGRDVSSAGARDIAIGILKDF